MSIKRKVAELTPEKTVVDQIDRVLLNGMPISDILRALHDKSVAQIFSRNSYECKNVNLSILTASHCYNNPGKYVEVAFMTKDWDWFNMDDKDNEREYDSDGSIIHYFPVVAIPVLIQALENADEESIRKAFYVFTELSYIA